jgi:hypothetical protein
MSSSTQEKPTQSTTQKSHTKHKSFIEVAETKQEAMLRKAKTLICNVFFHSFVILSIVSFSLTLIL